ncbi:MAG: chloramphenicol-sensitive protein RarD [Paracoccaceae bacterium]|jgi:chloramphenicol-sensitive protein RarD
MTDAQKGILAIVGASAIWGLSPIYYKQLPDVPAHEILAHRALWSFVFFGGILLLQGRSGEIFGAFSGWRRAGMLVAASLMISINWFLFIVAIQIGRTTETSLGYYIYPLAAVVIGWFWFGERLGRVQWVAIVLASFAVIVLTIGLGVAPWISLILAISFALYGVIKKQLPLGPVVSVTCEILIFLPIALTILLMIHRNGEGHFGVTTWDSVLLVASGPITAMPLILFTFGARRIAMSTVGLLLYINPTLQFFCAVIIFSEPFSRWHAISFSMIWGALLIYSIAARKASIAGSGGATTVRKPASSASTKP